MHAVYYRYGLEYFWGIWDEKWQDAGTFMQPHYPCIIYSRDQQSFKSALALKNTTEYHVVEAAIDLIRPLSVRWQPHQTLTNP